MSALVLANPHGLAAWAIPDLSAGIIAPSPSITRVKPRHGRRRQRRVVERKIRGRARPMAAVAAGDAGDRLGTLFRPAVRARADLGLGLAGGWPGSGGNCHLGLAALAAGIGRGTAVGVW